MSFYLVLKNIKSQHVNALNNINSVGFPAITAFLGLAESIGFNYKLKSNGTCIIHKGQELEAHNDKFGNIYTHKIKGSSYSLDGTKPSSIALSDQTSVLSFLSCSLIFSFEEDECLEMKKDLESGKLLHSFYAKKRIAGGSIVEIEKIKVYEDWESLNDYLSLEEKGFFVLDARKEIENRSNQKNQLETVRDLLYFQEEDFIPLSETDEFKKKWYALTSVGYYLINTPEERSGSRENKKHAFVENLLGLIEFRSKRDFEVGEEQDIFWQYEEQDSLIVAKQRYFN